MRVRFLLDKVLFHCCLQKWVQMLNNSIPPALLCHDDNSPFTRLHFIELHVVRLHTATKSIVFNPLSEIPLVFYACG